ncbi:MAG TPA: hypothetical protein VMK12_29420 [Anaeromyxobacteraceae bacterium]|nr:hypothetical protein [Anaeromyxobacteraceae bacterium]
MGGDPRTKLDVLYQDVLGEVEGLVERLEKVSAQLEAALRGKPAERVVEAIERAAMVGSGKLRADLDRAIGEARKGLGEAASEATAALHAVERERRRTLMQWTALTFCAAMLGGLVSAVVVHLMR